MTRLACPDYVLAKCGLSCSVFGQISVNLRAKRAQLAAFRKLIPFVFKHFLASFPLFLYFLGEFRGPHLLGHTSNPRRALPSRSRRLEAPVFASCRCGPGVIIPQEGRNSTTVVAHHTMGFLSSDKYENSGAGSPLLAAAVNINRPAVVARMKCQPALRLREEAGYRGLRQFSGCRTHCSICVRRGLAD